MRVAIYTPRVSSEQQAQEQTIASQVAALHEEQVRGCRWPLRSTKSCALS